MRKIQIIILFVLFPQIIWINLLIILRWFLKKKENINLSLQIRKALANRELTGGAYYNKITLVNIRFDLNACKNLSKKELDALSDKASNFFHFIEAFGKKLKLRDFVNIWMVEDRVQDLSSVTCDIFQIYFYENLFNPDENSKIQNQKRLNKRTTKTFT